MPGPLQTVSNKVTGSGTTTLATAITATQAASCLVIYVSVFGDTSSPATVTITSGTGGTGGSFAADNWTGASTSLGGTGIDAGIWADPNAATGTNAVKVTTNGTFTQTLMVIIEEWAGLALTSVVDATATPLRQSAGNTTWSVGPTGTTSQASELVVACAASFNSTSASFTLGTPGSPWTEETQVQDTSGYYQLLAAGYQAVSSTGTFSYSGTAAYKTTACIATLKSATSHPGAAALTGTGTLSGAGVFRGAAALSGSGTLGGTGTHTSGSRGVGTAALSGTGTLGTAATGTFTQAAALSGLGTLGGAWTATLAQSAAALAGTGTLNLAGVILGYPAALTGSGTLSVLQATGGLVFASPGATVPHAYPLSSQVAVAPPGSTAWRPLGSIGHVTTLTYSFTCPGGADKMSCTVMVPAAYRTQLFNPGWQVRITRGGHTVWTGRLDEPAPSMSGWTLTAVGDGNRGQDFLALYTSSWPNSQPDESINAAISRGLPWANPGVGSPSGAWFGQQVDSGAQTVTALLNLICTRGGLTWYVSSQPGGVPGSDLAVFPLPTVPNRLLVCTTPVARTLGGDINTIYLRYQATADTTSGTTSVPATYGIALAQNAQSVTAHGEIETFIDISDVGVMTAAAAQAVGSQVLAIYQRASWAGPFTASYGQLTTTGGQAIDPGADQAGTCVRLILTDYGYGGEVTPQFPVQFVVGGYEWDDLAQVATITPCQSVSQSLTGLLSTANTVLQPVTAAGP